MAVRVTNTTEARFCCGTQLRTGCSRKGEPYHLAWILLALSQRAVYDPVQGLDQFLVVLLIDRQLRTQPNTYRISSPLIAA